MKKFKKLVAILFSMSLVVSIFVGCAKTEVTQTNAQTEAKTEVQNETKSDDSTVIMRTGELTTMKGISYEDDPKYPTYLYDNINSLILALKSDKIDSIYLLPEVVARYIENNVEGVMAVEPQHLSGTVGLCLSTLKENIETYNLLNDAIDTLLNNGTIDRLNKEYLDKYLRTREEPKPIDMPKIDGAKTLKVAVTGDMPPIDFVASDGRPAGFNEALLSEISKIANVNIELIQVNSGARLTALNTNTVDAVFYTCQIKSDNKKYEIYEKDDLPNEIINTKPYYTSRIYEVDSSKKLQELAAKGMIASSETQVESQFISGVFFSASLTEKEQNDNLKEFEWGDGINVKYFDNLSQMMLALRSGQIDFISLLPKSTAEYIRARNADIAPYNSPATDSDKIKYSMATLEGNKEIYNILNDTLNEIINDGTIKTIEAKYVDGFIENKENPKVVDMPHFDNAKTIKVAVTGDLPPFDFVSTDGKPAGYNVALLSVVANRARINIELVPMDEKAKVTALATKNIDAIFWLSGVKIADETDTYYDCPNGVILTDCYYEDDLYDICIKGGNADKMFSEK